MGEIFLNSLPMVAVGCLLIPVLILTIYALLLVVVSSRLTVLSLHVKHCLTASAGPSPMTLQWLPPCILTKKTFNLTHTDNHL